jgi:acyl carrier protein
MRVIKDLSELYKIIQPDFLIKLIKEMCYGNTFDLNSKNWSDLGLDDLDIVEMIMKMEMEYDITISDNMLENIEYDGFFDFYSNLTLIKRNNVLEKLGI